MKTRTCKERGNYAVGACFRDCANRSEKTCSTCIHFDMFEPTKKGEKKVVNTCNV